MLDRTTKSPRERQIQQGYSRMASSHAVICGLARNCNSTLPPLKKKLDHVGRHFGKCDFLVVENDSSDGTAETLQDWAQEDQRVCLLQYCLIPPQSPHEPRPVSRAGWFSEDRISRIAFARNLYLDRLSQYPDADYVIVLDLDIHAFDLDGIAHSIGSDLEWSCMAANCIRYSPRHPFRRWVYWDTFAYEPLEGFEGGVQTRVQMLTTQKTLPKILSRTGLLEARSAFGGLAIYRKEVLEAGDYRVSPNDDPIVTVTCEHRELHRQLAKNSRFRLFINHEQKVLHESTSSVLRRLLKDGYGLIASKAS